MTKIEVVLNIDVETLSDFSNKEVDVTNVEELVKKELEWLGAAGIAVEKLDLKLWDED